MAQSNISAWISRHSNLVKAMAIAGAALTLLLFATIPLLNNVRETSGQLSVKRRESRELADKVSILASLDENTLSERVRILDRALPPKKDVVLYLSTIEGLSRELGLNFGGISLSPGEVTEATGSAKPSARSAAKRNLGGLDTLETEIDITGSQDSIYAFLRLVEESAPLMSITDVKVSGGTGGAYVLSLKLAMLYAITDTKQVKGAITLFDEKEEEYFQKLAEFRRFDTAASNTPDSNLGKTDLFESFTLQQ